MPAAPLVIPATATHVPYRVPYADTDMMGVVYYANYLTLFERCRGEMMRERGLPYAELEKMGTLLPVSEAHVNYRASARYDDLLDLVGWVEEARGVRLRIHCAIYRGAELLVEGYTVHPCIDAKTHRPTRIPAALAALCPQA